MSHHLDSPLARKDPRLNISDVYLFKGKTGTVFVMNVNPQSGANGYHHEAMYEFKVDVSGNAVEDLTFRVTFGERSADKQSITVRQLTGPEATDRMAEGTVIAQGSTDEVLQAENGVRIFAGSAGEPFYIEGRVVTAVKTAIAEGHALDMGDFDPSTAANLFGNTNVSAIVLEIPDELLADTIGFWGTVALATDAGGWRQVQRAATPLMTTLYDFTEIHIDDEGTHGDYNATTPSEDMKLYGDYVKKKTATVVAAMKSADDPEAYAEALCQKLFPDVLHYQVGTEATFTVGERNGRDMVEPTPDVMFELALNHPVSMGLDASSATGELRSEFPYVSLPINV